MRRLIVTLICHAELGAPRDTPSVSTNAVFQKWIPRFTSLLDQIEKDTGKRIPITWSCCANHSREFIGSEKVLCAQHFPEIWRALRDRGDEIGLHSHPPEEEGFEGCWSQDRFIQEDVERMVDFGFEPPKTYVPAMFMWRDELAATLIEASFEASSSVIALPSKYLAWVQPFDVLKIPIERCLLSTHQSVPYPFRPYRVSESSLAKPGSSELVELPVIGYLGKWDHPDFANSPPYDLTVRASQLVPRNWIANAYLAYEEDTGRPFPSLRQRWESREEVEVDIWPTFFHPFEMNEDRLVRTSNLLREIATWDDVSFATALDAVRAWKRASPKGGEPDHYGGNDA